MPPAGLTFEELLANLSLEEHAPSPARAHRPRAPPPYRPASPSAPPTSTAPPSTPPSTRNAAQPLSSPPPQTPPHSRGTVYYFESPTERGYTTNWATAGAATQGIDNAHVRRVQKAAKKKRKAQAYVVFFGLTPGVYRIWEDAKAMVSRVRGAIYRGYPTLEEAEAAFAYAQACGWTRASGRPYARLSMNAIGTLPSPSQEEDAPNPLSGSEDLDNIWYVVYRGITPGVYRSMLEAQLNTVAVANSLYEGIEGKDNAYGKFAAAASRGETSVAPPPAVY
ncbi:hypothetical protein B0H14DRAFT_3526678 [Mycena olivaceomarginata]|nr:hypothetical protein B0H14DRAFT_3526678 [Mycena olivaceomarginata]